MAKKKKKKEENTKSFQYSVELNGLLLILIGVIGFGTFGPVGKIIKNFAIFLMGSWYVVALLGVLLIGIYMIFKRKMPNLFSNRIIGFYFLLIAVLMFSHLEYAIANELKGKVIITTTIDNFMGATSHLNSNVGGGIIGALFIVLFTSLFDITGAKITIGVLIVFGFILLFDITIADIFKKIKEIFIKIKAKKAEKDNIPITNSEDEELEEDKVVITSAEELKTFHTTSVPEENNNGNNISLNNSITYKLPPIELLDPPKKNNKVNSNDFIRSNKEVLERALNDFGIQGKVVEVHIGPTVTQYEVVVPTGTKLSRVSSINKEIALALAAKDVRIEAPIPGKSTIGIEIPNKEVSPVKIREVITKVDSEKVKNGLIVTLGKNIAGTTINADLTTMPHLLVAGSTGSGKSVCINSIIISLLMHYRPDEVKLVLVDPKQVELSNYNGVPHLLCPVVTDPQKASIALQKVVDEMDRRYRVLAEKGAKKISDYNKIIEKENLKNPENPQPKMNYLVVIVDEMADLMIVARKEVENSIMRITQLARAAGIHLIVATQRPSADVITGVIKTNIPSRIAFSVASYVDSRTILDTSGAEKLLGKGDMLYLPMGANHPIRIQGCFISDQEIHKVIDYVCKQQKAMYDDSLLQLENSNQTAIHNEKEEYDDPLYNEIVDFAIQTGKISASLLQRRFRLGYNRAARIVDLLEERGIIGPPNGSKPREVLVKLQENKDE